jgi:uncharacterized protein YcbK (DUF882 family)
LIYLTDNFTFEELKCRGQGCCGGSAPMDSVLLKALQDFRDEVNIPIIPLSGFRCLAYNSTIPDSSPTSYHTQGRAVDIPLLPGYTQDKMSSIARRIPTIGGIGLYQWGIHIDTGPVRYW